MCEDITTDTEPAKTEGNYWVSQESSYRLLPKKQLQALVIFPCYRISASTL